MAYLQEALAGLREDTYYAADGVISGPPLLTSFIANDSELHEARTLNWSVGAERELSANTTATVSYLDKRGSNEFVYANQESPALSGTYLLTDGRIHSYCSAEFDMRHSFSNGYVLFGSYTRSFTHTNAALDYSPTISVLGPQQPGPLPWDSPNRMLSWGWLPIPESPLIHLPKGGWDFVYSLDWRTGFPYTSVNANQQEVGLPGSMRFPDYLAFDPGLEWKFHFHGAYFGLRGILENATGRQNPLIVNNVVDSSQYGVFSQPEGRAFTARLRLIGSK